MRFHINRNKHLRLCANSGETDFQFTSFPAPSTPARKAEFRKAKRRVERQITKHIQEELVSMILLEEDNFKMDHANFGWGQDDSHYTHDFLAYDDDDALGEPDTSNEDYYVDNDTWGDDDAWDFYTPVNTFYCSCCGARNTRYKD